MSAAKTRGPRKVVGGSNSYTPVGWKGHEQYSQRNFPRPAIPSGGACALLRMKKNEALVRQREEKIDPADW